MRKQLFGIVLMALLGMVACGGGGPVDPPDNFDRMTATVQGTDGTPLAGLSVRVEGRDTGVTTNAAGGFILGRDAFSKGVTVENEISLGRNGVVVGTQVVVPVDNPDLLIRFGTDPGTGTGSIEGNIYNEKTGELLDAVEITLFSDMGGVLMGSSENGHYKFSSVGEGTWRITAYEDGFHPKTAMIKLEAGQDVIQHLALTPEGTVGTGEGVVIAGTLTDSETHLPVPGALVTMYVDTGYYGIPEPWLYDYGDSDAGWGGDDVVGIAVGEPEPAKDPSSMPFRYEPQYYETTTDSNGEFIFPEVAGFSAWFDFSAEGYHSGNHYEQIDGVTGSVILSLEIEPYIPTDITGIVVDENGDPVEGAYVEFIYGGNYGPMPMDIAVPGGTDWEEVAEDGVMLFNTTGAPVPPQDTRGEDDQWADFESAAGAMPLADGAADNMDNSGFGGSSFDNELLQRFRFENRNSDKSSSDVYFDGYYWAITEEDGTFVFNDVPTGNYYVFADAYRHLSYSSDKEVEADPLLNDFTIVCPKIPVGSVEGTITDENGNVIDDVLVNATQPFADPFTYSDSNGHYRIDNIPVGDWLIGAYKKGYMTSSELTEIREDFVVTINLVIQTYNPPTPTLISYSGQVVNGSDSSSVAGADMVFTPVNDEYGGYYQHVVSSSSGGFTAELIPTEYNVLIQREGYEDLYIRIWVDSLYPTMDFWLWPIGAGSGRGGWGGFVDDGMLIEPMPAEMPDMGPPPDEF